MSEASCPAKKSRKLRCCSARQRVVKRNSPLRVIALRAPSEGAPHSIAEVLQIHTRMRGPEESNWPSLKGFTAKKGLLLRIFLGRVGSAADVEMAQILERRFVFFAHAPCEVGVVQPRVARRFRHILQHAQLLLDHALSLRLHLLPSGHHFVTDLGALL